MGCWPTRGLVTVRGAVYSFEPVFVTAMAPRGSSSRGKDTDETNMDRGVRQMGYRPTRVR